MAAEFLASHGIDLQAEMDTAQASNLQSQELGHSITREPRQSELSLNLDVSPPIPVTAFDNVLLPSSSIPQTLQIASGGCIASISQSNIPPSVSSDVRSPILALPSLCHPHVHLDKPHLLTHSQTSHLSPKSGSFPEALSLTGEAKKDYTRSSLLERGKQLIADSVRAGVTHMRAFVEVDTTVDLLCVEVGLELKRAWAKHMEIQICAFAQDPIFTNLSGGGNKEYMEGGNPNLILLIQALGMEGVDVLGATPYVEATMEAQRRNIAWAVSTALEKNLHLDFHLDYNLDPNKEPMVWTVLEALCETKWNEKQTTHEQGRKTVVLGHCTRLTLFSADEWTKLATIIHENELPVYFVGSPTSDLFMQGRPDSLPSNSKTDLAAAAHRMVAASNRPRCTLHIPSLWSDLGLKCALGINNVGNAFTPFGTADPLGLACWGVGIYQVGTVQGVRSLYAAVSWMAREAVGLGRGGRVSDKERDGNTLQVGDRADIVLFGEFSSSGVFDSNVCHSKDGKAKFQRVRRSVEEVVWDPGVERTVVFGGKVVCVD